LKTILKINVGNFFVDLTCIHRKTVYLEYKCWGRDNYGDKYHFQQYFSYVEVSFIGGGNPEKNHQPGASH
jgi:hypothetical protein